MPIFKKYWFLLVIIIVAVILYSGTFNLYFFQDDFFHFKMASAQSLSDFLNFFSFKNNFDYSFYRPLSTQVFLFLTKSVFGYEPLYFHLVGFVAFILNTFLIFKICEAITKNRQVGILVSLIYTVNPSNLANLSYVSVFEEISMASFLFLAFLSYLKNNKLAWIFFIFSLLCRENALILPVILVIYEMLLGKKVLKSVVPFGIILFVYILLRFAGGIPDASVYQPVIDLRKILNGYSWYFAWGMGWPEMFVDYIGSGFKINPNLFRWYDPSTSLIFLSSLVSLILFATGFIKTKLEEKRISIFFLSIFIVGLLPVIFWPWHKFSYYLTIPAFGLLAAYVFSLHRLSKKYLILGLFSVILTSLLTINLMYKTYWAINRARISRNLILDLKKQYPSLPKAAILYFKNDPSYPKISGFGNSSTQASYILSGENGPQIVYNDNSLKVLYEDTDRVPGGNNVYFITAKIIQ